MRNSSRLALNKTESTYSLSDKISLPIPCRLAARRVSSLQDFVETRLVTHKHPCEIEFIDNTALTDNQGVWFHRIKC